MTESNKVNSASIYLSAGQQKVLALIPVFCLPFIVHLVFTFGGPDRDLTVAALGLPWLTGSLVFALTAFHYIQKELSIVSWLWRAVVYTLLILALLDTLDLVETPF